MRDPKELADPRRVLAWDLDGTIADTRWDIATGIVEMCRELERPPLELSQVIRNVGHGVKELVTRCLVDTGQPARDEAEIARGIASFRTHYWAHLMDTTAAYPGMESLVRGLVDRGQPMVIVSNKPEDAVREILRRMGLLDCFSVVIGGDTLPTRKPDPAPLWHALEQCRPGARPDEAVMIGDSLPDIEAARAAGMPACGVAWGFDPEGHMRRVELDWWFETVDELRLALGVY
jgi:phosphoglycolate phosphatase